MELHLVKYAFKGRVKLATCCLLAAQRVS